MAYSNFTYIHLIFRSFIFLVCIFYNVNKFCCADQASGWWSGDGRQSCADCIFYEFFINKMLLIGLISTAKTYILGKSKRNERVWRNSWHMRLIDKETNRGKKIVPAKLNCRLYQYLCAMLWLMHEICTWQWLITNQICNGCKRNEWILAINWYETKFNQTRLNPVNSGPIKWILLRRCNTQSERYTVFCRQANKFILM